MGIARADSLEDVLARMDATAKAFKSYSANLTWVDYTKILNLKDTTNGAMRLQRDKNGVSGIIDMTAGPDPYVIHLNGSKTEKFYPKANEVQEGNLRKLGAFLDRMVLLGFAVTKAELLRDYDVKLVGPDKVDSDGATRIALSPKSAETLKVVKTIELWILDGKGYPVQIKETSPEGNYRLFTFSKLVLNPTDLPASAFELPPAAARAKRTKVN
jgi:outer membrane lipoprotein-sorting protein